MTQVKEEILRRCSEANILHIAVDTQSEEGTVYIKTAGMEDAGKVFRWVEEMVEKLAVVIGVFTGVCMGSGTEGSW